MPKRSWKTYEEVAQYLLNHFAEHFKLGSVEGKQIVPGKSGANWEIDAKGVKRDGEGFIIVECRRYTKSRLNQESIAGLAFRIQDTGAQGGIIVSPLELQSGAKKVAKCSNVIPLTLDVTSTTTDYIMKFLNHVFIGVSDQLRMSDSFHVKIYDKDGNLTEEK